MFSFPLYHLMRITSLLEDVDTYVEDKCGEVMLGFADLGHCLGSRAHARRKERADQWVALHFAVRHRRYGFRVSNIVITRQLFSVSMVLSIISLLVKFVLERIMT